ncbi:MAG: FecCD family ABC transporter permease [Janibacter sp.]
MERVAAGRRTRHRRRTAVIIILAFLVVAAWCATLMLGQSVHGPAEVIGAVLGTEQSGASFIVGELRLPRASLGLAIGLSFGLAGSTFQTLLRNPLASPDIIGITTGASAAAAVAIVTFGLGGLSVSVAAVTTGIAVAFTVYLLAYRRGQSAGTRLILIGVGVASMMSSVIAWQLDRASNVQIAEAMRWLTGSLNGAHWHDVRLVLLALLLCGAVILHRTRELEVSTLGDDAAAALGVRVERLRILIVVAAVALICFATAAAGPIVFLAFLSGPIAARLVGPRGSVLVPAALTGALLVLVGDFIGQFALGTRLPVGVITGILGAPYLLYLIIRTNRTGGAL